MHRCPLEGSLAANLHPLPNITCPHPLPNMPTTNRTLSERSTRDDDVLDLVSLCEGLSAPYKQVSMHYGDWLIPFHLVEAT